MNKKLKKTAAAIGGGAALLAGTALVADQLPSSAAATGSADLVWSGPPTQVIRVPALDTDPVYGRTIDLRATGGASGNPVIATSTTPVTCEVEPGTQQIHLTHVGTCRVFLSQQGGAGYGARTAAKEFVVTPAPLTLRVLDTNRPEGNFAIWGDWALSYTGLTNGDTGANITNLSFDLPSETSPPGDYPIALTGAENPNYEFTFVPGDLTIEPVIQAVGLPDGAHQVLWVKRWFDWDPSEVMIYGESLTYYFKPVYSAPDGKLYITIAPGHVGPVTVSQTARYVTMDSLIADETTNPDARTSLGIRWDRVMAQTGTTREASLHALASAVRAWSGYGAFTPAQMTDVLKYLQVVYQWFGYAGTV